MLASLPAAGILSFNLTDILMQEELEEKQITDWEELAEYVDSLDITPAETTDRKPFVHGNQLIETSKGCK